MTIITVMTVKAFNARSTRNSYLKMMVMTVKVMMMMVVVVVLLLVPLLLLLVKVVILMILVRTKPIVEVIKTTISSI